MKIMVFLHGTVVMHKSGLARTRRERVQQVMDHEESVGRFASYVPIDGAVAKLRRWREQGADIFYVTFRRGAADVEADKTVLLEHHFPEGPILSRGPAGDFSNVVERVMPDVLIEDDCESIGGEMEMISPQLKPEVRRGMRVVVVREFGGIDHLPDDLSGLQRIG